MSEVRSSVSTQEYKYNVYLSYGSADRSWAQTLFERLEQRGIEVFLDSMRLESATEWPAALSTGLRSSQHLLVLWSESAQQSAWVQREVAEFESVRDASSVEEVPSDRRVIFLLLEGAPRRYADYQMIVDLREANVYAGAPDEVELALWERVVNKVYDAISPRTAQSQLETLAQEGRFREALSVASSISDDLSRSQALRYLGTALAQAGHYDEAIEVANTIAPVGLRVEMLIDLGLSLARWGEDRSASTVFEMAEQDFLVVEDTDQRARLLDLLTDALGQVGRQDEVRRLEGTRAAIRESIANEAKADEVTEQEPRGEPSEPAQRELIDIAARALADEYSEVDQLGFEDYAEALADFIKDPKTSKPLTISIDAPWGMGKTTLMRMIKRRLNPESSSNERTPAANDGQIPTVWFNAWRHDEEGSLWAALALEILSQVREGELSLQQRAILRYETKLWYRFNRERRFRNNIVKRMALRFLKSWLPVLALLLIALLAIIVLWAVGLLEEWVRRAWQAIVVIGGLGVIATLYNTIVKDLYRGLTNPFRLNVSDYVSRESPEEKTRFLSQFEDDFKWVVSTVTREGARPLVVFIDDLDRAAPPKPAEIFEAINLLLDSPHCVFILGMDSQMVAKSIEAKYKDLVGDVAENNGESTIGRRFLEKIVQIPFVIPRADLPTFKTFVNRSLAAGGPGNDLPVDETSEQRSAEVEQRIEQRREQGQSMEEAVQAVQAEDRFSKRQVSDASREVSAREFVRDFEDSEEVRRAVADAIPYLEYNPRKMKRFINLLKLQALIAKRRELLDAGIIKIESLAKWLIIAMRWPATIEAVALACPRFLYQVL